MKEDLPCKKDCFFGQEDVGKEEKCPKCKSNPKVGDKGEEDFSTWFQRNGY
jgi:hypothetical protein